MNSESVDQTEIDAIKPNALEPETRFGFEMQLESMERSEQGGLRERCARKDSQLRAEESAGRTRLSTARTSTPRLGLVEGSFREFHSESLKDKVRGMAEVG